VALGGWPMPNFPVALFEVGHDGVGDLVLLARRARKSPPSGAVVAWGSLSAAVVVRNGGIPAAILGLLDDAQRLMPLTRRRVALGAGSAAGVAGSGTTFKAGAADLGRYHWGRRRSGGTRRGQTAGTTLKPPETRSYICLKVNPFGNDRGNFTYVARCDRAWLRPDRNHVAKVRP
jgi:hypothetical protein